MMRLTVAVALGSALGALARQGVRDLALLAGLDAFPWDTLAVNTLGSFLIGLLAGLTAADGRVPLSPAQQQFLMGGFCGGFTTFSIFSVESIELLSSGRPMAAFALITVTMVLALAGCLAGLQLGGRNGGPSRGG